MDAEHQDVKLSLSKFAERTYTTFISRTRAAERLSVRGMLWNIALATSSTTTLAISVVSLSNPIYLGGRANLLACLFSILTLVLSLIVALFNYGARSRDMFHSYRTIQRVSVEAERLAGTGLSEQAERDELARLSGEYQLGLDQSENHTTLDYHLARRLPKGSDASTPERKERRRATLRQGSLTLLPVAVILSAACFLIWIVFSL